MNLRAFHLIFLAASIIMDVFFGFWAVREYRSTEESGMIALAIASFVVTVLLLAYTPWFWRKTRHLGYL